jgi:ribonuclease H / adenosylcobalamin/alpha-ribazole phosphatase
VSRRLVVEADGGSRGNPGPAGYGAVVRDAVTGDVLAEVSDSLGRATNNVAEYSGLIAGLRAAAGLARGADVEVRMDSKLVVEQMSGRWQIKHPDMRPLAARARQAARALGRVEYTWVPRARNAHADRLANEAMDAARGARGQPPGRDRRGAGDRPRGARSADESGAGGGREAGERTKPGWSDLRGKPATTVLLRHGETPLSPERRFAGRGDIPLTEAGLRQAEAAAQRLAARGDLGLIVSSPLQRARRTAEAVATAAGVPLVVQDAWAETDFGEWEGLTFSQVAERWPDEAAAWVAHSEVAPPGGESIAAASERVLSGLAALLAAHPGETVLIVSHVTPMKVLLQHALLAPPAALRRMHLEVACLCEIDWYDGGMGVVRSLNDTAHLQPRNGAISAYAENHGGRAGRAAAPG